MLTLARIQIARWTLWRSTVAAVVLSGVAACGGGGGGGDDDPVPVATHTATFEDIGTEDFSILGGPAFPKYESFDAQTTVRQVVRIALGGEGLRIRLSNQFGKSALTFDRVRIAKSAGSGSIVPSSDMPVTFGGSSAITIAPGAEAWSDKIPMSVGTASDLAVSVYGKSRLDAATAQLNGNPFYVGSGDAASDASLAPAPAPPAPAISLTPLFWLGEIDVYRSQATNVIVAVGDSITDANIDRKAWSEYLFDRISASSSQPPTSVVNMGIGGNRLLNDFTGTAVARRFDHDVLRTSGATHAIVEIGINDIGFGLKYFSGQPVSAPIMIDALTKIAAQGTGAGIKVFFTTIVPYRGSEDFSEEGESIRQAVNQWIRTNSVASGFFEFERAVNDPADPSRYLADYTVGDFLHPNEAGAQRQAASVDLEKLR